MNAIAGHDIKNEPDAVLETPTGSNTPEVPGMSEQTVSPLAAAVNRHCKCCGRKFSPHLSNVRIGRGHFCSRSCMYEARKQQNNYRVRADGTAEIDLTQGKVAIIDATDLHKVLAYKWQAHKSSTGSYYARTLTGGKSLGMHNIILPCETGYTPDHKDLDGLNNRRSNLRPATFAQNVYNRKPKGRTSKFKGVCWNKRNGKWYAQIRVNGKSIALGNHTAEESAARAYDAAAQKYWGEFAWLNFPEGCAASHAQ